MTNEAKELLKDKPELCKEIYLTVFNRWDEMEHIYGIDDFEKAFDDLLKEHTKKDWEILSFKDNEANIIMKLKSGRYTNNDRGIREWTYDFALEEVQRALATIHSVLRLSDNAVFTDDEITNQGKIKEFIIENGDMRVLCDNPTFTSAFNIHYLTKRTPLFTTEDGKDFFKGDSAYVVEVPTLGIYPAKPITYCRNKDYKYFSTREAAEKWVEDNKPIFSKAQLKELNDTLDKFLNK